MEKDYCSPYEACPLARVSINEEELCDFEIQSDRVASLCGLLASMCAEKREDILKIGELTYHAAATLSTFMSVTPEEIEWLRLETEALKADVKAGQTLPASEAKCQAVIPGGETRGALAHVIRVEGKQLVRILYRAREKGMTFPNELIDFANLISGYFHMLAGWLNMKDGYTEIPFESRNYK